MNSRRTINKGAGHGQGRDCKKSTAISHSTRSTGYVYYTVYLFANNDRSDKLGYRQKWEVYLGDIENGTFRGMILDPLPTPTPNFGAEMYSEKWQIVNSRHVKAITPEEALRKYREWQSKGLDAEYLLT